MHILRLFALSLVLALTACGGGGGSTDSSLGFTTYATGSSSAFAEPTTLVIRSAQELAAITPRLNQDGQLRQSDSAVDFANFMVLGVFLGGASNGCYSISVERVDLAGNRLQVGYRINTPSANAICTLAFVYPFQLITVRKSDVPIDFVRLN